MDLDYRTLEPGDYLVSSNHDKYEVVVVTKEFFILKNARGKEVSFRISITSKTTFKRAPRTITQYLNVYPSGAVGAHESRARADRNAGRKRSGCVKVEVTEGVWDD